MDYYLFRRGHKEGLIPPRPPAALLLQISSIVPRCASDSFVVVVVSGFSASYATSKRTANVYRDHIPVLQQHVHTAVPRGFRPRSGHNAGLTHLYLYFMDLILPLDT